MNDDTELDAAFAALRTATVPYIKPAGIDQARATVRQRRRVRAVALAAAVVVVVLPVAAHATFRGSDAPRPPVGGTGTAIPTSPTPDDTASPSPSEEPTPPACGAGPTPGSVPPGGIPAAELCGATLTLPAWTNATACPSGKVRLTNGSYFIAESFFLNVGNTNLASDADVAYADVDHDGSSETLLLLSCGGEMWVSEVLALQRGSGGAITTLGRVVTTGATIRRLVSVAAGPGGTVQVEVADWNGGLGDDGSLAQRQVRGFGWNGQRFVQVAGPTSFPVNPRVTDLTATATNLAFGPAKAGQRTGTISVTIHNAGPSSAAYSVFVQLPGYAELTPAVAGCTNETFPQPVIDVTCTATTLAPGASRTLTLTFRAPANADQITVELVPRASVRIAEGHGDPVFANDDADFSITFA